VAQRVVEAVKARESKRLFHSRNKKTVADQIQKFAQVVASDHVTVARKAMVSSLSVIGGSKFSYDLFGCKLRFRLGREVIWRHRAMHRVAPDGTSQSGPCEQRPLASAPGCARR
jgi:hypothetical protein